MTSCGPSALLRFTPPPAATSSGVGSTPRAPPSVNEQVARHHAQLVVVEKRKFQRRSPQRFIIWKSAGPDRGAARAAMQAALIDGAGCKIRGSGGSEGARTLDLCRDRAAL